MLKVGGPWASNFGPFTSWLSSFHFEYTSALFSHFLNRPHWKRKVPGNSYGHLERDLNKTTRRRHHQAHRTCWRSSPCATGGSGVGSVPAESDGFLQGFQCPDSKVQAWHTHGRHHYGFQGQYLWVHRKVAVGHMVPEESRRDRVWERPPWPCGRLYAHCQAHLRYRQSQAVRSFLPVHATRVHL